MCVCVCVCVCREVYIIIWMDGWMDEPSLIHLRFPKYIV